MSVTDNAGNTAAGVPPRIDDRATACAPATAARSRCAGACSRPRAARSRTSRSQATATISRHGATAEPAGTATTDARGRFALRLPAGPSRIVRLTVAGGGGLLPAVRAVAVRVPASSTIRASRRAVSAGTRVMFSGRIRARRASACPRAA